jgi:hypothetical protein
MFQPAAHIKLTKNAEVRRKCGRKSVNINIGSGYSPTAFICPFNTPKKRTKGTSQDRAVFDLAISMHLI